MTRHIEQDERGNYYSTDAVSVYCYTNDDPPLTLIMSPDALYAHVYAGFKKVSQPAPVVTETEEMNALRKTLVSGMRTAVKGVLIMWGDQLLTLFYGSRNHPRPPKDKHLDLVDWYMQEFSKIAIAHAMRNDLHLVGARLDNVITISTIYAKPVTPDTPATEMASTTSTTESDTATIAAR